MKFNEVGSGVLVSSDGKVLTAAHVVQIADAVTVHFQGGQTETARVVARVDGKDVPLGGDIVLAAMGIQLDDATSFQKVRDRWARLRSGDEMTFSVLRAGRVIELKGRLP